MFVVKKDQRLVSESEVNSERRQWYIAMDSQSNGTD